MSDDNKPEDNFDAPKLFRVSQDLSNYPVTITLHELLQYSLAMVRAANLEFENRQLKREAVVKDRLITDLEARLTAAENRAAVAEHFAAHDPLTGAKRKENIKELLRKAHDEVTGNRRSVSHSLSIIVADIDFFKKINTVHGHHDADLVLATVGNTLGKYKRQSDPLAQFSDEVGRYGGEEFLIVLPYCDRHQAVVIAEKMRLAVEDIKHVEDPKTGEKKAIPITMSFGVVSHTFTLDNNEDTLFKRGDAALYEAKNFGRNAVVTMDNDGRYSVLRKGHLVDLPVTPDTKIYTPMKFLPLPEQK